MRCDVIMNLMEIIGKNIKYLRIKKGLSQQQLANKIDKDRSSIAYWESGKTTISLESLAKLSEVFNIPFSELMKEESEDDKEKKEDLIFFDKLLKKNNILDDSHILNIAEYDKIINFLKINIDFLIDFDSKSKERK